MTPPILTGMILAFGQARLDVRKDGDDWIVVLRLPPAAPPEGLIVARSPERVAALTYAGALFMKGWEQIIESLIHDPEFGRR